LNNYWREHVARGINRLKPLQIERLSAPGRYSDGGGLYLAVGKTGAKAWVFLYMRGYKPEPAPLAEADETAGKPHKRPVRHELGLGSLHDVPVADARAKAATLRAVLDKGGDPKAERNRQRAVTFTAAAEQYIAAHKAGWRAECPRDLALCNRLLASGRILVQSHASSANIIIEAGNSGASLTAPPEAHLPGLDPDMGWDNCPSVAAKSA
jgi:hypothetical protein